MELKELMKNSGMVGAGGAGFPSYAKLIGGIDTLLINGAECEPLLYTDYTILKTERDTVIAGALAVMEGISIPRAILALKKHTAERLGISDGECLAKGVTVKVLANVYPLGDEISLIYECTGRLVQPGKLPSSVGTIVYNVETLYNLGMAKEFNTPVYMKWLTVGGDIEKPVVVRVPVGTPVSELFDRLGIKVPETHELLDGGPSMGKPKDPGTATVTKTTKGLLVLPKSSQAIIGKHLDPRMAKARAETACCQCTRCTDMCPRALLGYPLEPHKMVRSAMGAAVVLPKMVISATLCCGCGICESLSCCQGISPKSVIAGYKALLAENKMRFSSDEIFEVSPEREYRKVPTERWMRTLGVADLDKLPEYIGERVDFKRFTVHTRQGIGSPARPTVKQGDTVKRGEMIAEASEGLSIPLHSPCDGRVILVTDDKITIENTGCKTALT